MFLDVTNLVGSASCQTPCDDTSGVVPCPGALRSTFVTVSDESILAQVICDFN